MLRPAFLAAVVLAATLAGVGDAARPGPDSAPIEVVVRLASPPLALATGDTAAAGRRIAAEQAALVDALERAIPEATPRWRYRIVANGVAVVLPERAVPRLGALPGVRDVLRGTTYTAALDRSPGRIGAPALWGPELGSAGQGVK
ncbi:MAG: hypothetical protein OEW31_10985, partial [Thermoleophilia bacterium]|nr:hypothetical protein [Thermoleophilia bacterium]